MTRTKKTFMAFILFATASGTMAGVAFATSGNFSSPNGCTWGQSTTFQTTKVTSLGANCLNQSKANLYVSKPGSTAVVIDDWHVGLARADRPTTAWTVNKGVDCAREGSGAAYCGTQFP